jgi:TolA-binding protein
MTGNLNDGGRHCPDDLVVRGQHGDLTEIERRALAAHLAQCAECRSATALTALFDAIPDSQPGDADLLARVADKAVRSPRRFSRWREWRVAAVVALAVLTSGAATASWMAYRHASMERRARDPLPPARGERTRSSAGTRRAGALAPAPEERPGAADETPSPARPERGHRLPGSAARPPTPVVSPEASAASLFFEANAVRRSGDVRKAIGLYRSLRERFPESSQALLSAVSLGDLFLGEGDAPSAIAAYGAYLRGSPNGALTEEALFGQARGLRLLGRDAEERQAWRDLLRRFPRSAYQSVASRRLREIAP